MCEEGDVVELTLFRGKETVGLIQLFCQQLSGMERSSPTVMPRAGSGCRRCIPSGHYDGRNPTYGNETILLVKRRDEKGLPYVDSRALHVSAEA